jgi:hypothetical protein
VYRFFRSRALLIGKWPTVNIKSGPIQIHNVILKLSEQPGTHDNEIQPQEQGHIVRSGGLAVLFVISMFTLPTAGALSAEPIRYSVGAHIAPDMGDFDSLDVADEIAKSIAKEIGKQREVIISQYPMAEPGRGI